MYTFVLLMKDNVRVSTKRQCATIMKKATASKKTLSPHKKQQQNSGRRGKGKDAKVQHKKANTDTRVRIRTAALHGAAAALHVGASTLLVGLESIPPPSLPLQQQQQQQGPLKSARLSPPLRQIPPPQKNRPTASKVVPKESIPHTRTCKMGCKKAILEMPTVDDIQGSMVRSCCTLAILRPCYCSW